MSFYKKKNKYSSRYQPPREPNEVDRKLESLRKNLRGTIIFKSEKTGVSYETTGRYHDKAEFEKEVESFVESFEKLESGNKWTLVSQNLANSLFTDVDMMIDV